MLRSVAAAKLRTEWLPRWWCKKYNRPLKDPLLAEYTPEELMIEYLMDCVELDPAEEFPTSVQEAGTYARKTGDSLLDRWQEAAARGDKIDFDEAFSDPESLRAFAAAKAASKARHEAKRGARAAAPGDVHDDYTKGT